MRITDAAGRIPPRLAVPALTALACLFAGNHVAARLAFDHGASVATAVAMRSGVTALALLVLIGLRDVSLAMPRRTLARALAVGLLVAIQSYCLYSAVAAIPVALALLAFNTYPLLFMLLTWALGGGPPEPRALVAVPLAFVGLVLALDVAGSLGALGARWREIGTGVSWALAGSAAFAVALHLTMRHLRDLDGRVRTMLAMGVTALAVVAFGAAGGGLALPVDGRGWTGLLLATALYGTAITVVFLVMPRLARPSNAAALNFEPVAAIALGWAILGQRIEPIQLAGAAVIVGALLLLGSERR
ncbi:MAG TPA: DMT family transporter [Gammaproteobacteria bacterium]